MLDVVHWWDTETHAACIECFIRTDSVAVVQCPIAVISQLTVTGNCQAAQVEHQAIAELVAASPIRLSGTLKRERERDAGIVMGGVANCVCGRFGREIWQNHTTFLLLCMCVCVSVAFPVSYYSYIELGR